MSKGEIRGTEGVDGDKLDVYVGENHDSPVVVVIHQHNPWDGKYDEDKCMIGFDSVEEAIGAYKKQYDRPGFYREDEHTAIPIGAFWRWVQNTRNKGKKVTAAVRRITIGETSRRLKDDGWRNDHHNRSYDMRTASFFSIYIVQFRHNGTKAQHFQVTWYTGGTRNRWDSKTVDTLKEAVQVANRVKPESDRISAEELGESPEGKLAARYMKQAGWWAIEPGMGGGIQSQSTGLYNGDDPADIMDAAIKRIVDAYLETWGRKPYLEEMSAVWDFSGNEDVLQKIDGLEWAEKPGLHPPPLDIDAAIDRIVDPCFDGQVQGWDKCASRQGRTASKYTFSINVDYRDVRGIRRLIRDYYDTECPYVEEDMGPQGGVFMEFKCLTATDAYNFLDDLNNQGWLQLDDQWLVKDTLQKARREKAARVTQPPSNKPKAEIMSTPTEIVNRWISRRAAEVGTDSATIYAIAPEMLIHLIEGGKFVEAWNEDPLNIERCDKLVRQHGGAVFHTGGDGTWDVKIPTEKGHLPIVEEKGYMKPYGTEEFDEAIKKVAIPISSPSSGDIYAISPEGLANFLAAHDWLAIWDGGQGAEEADKLFRQWGGGVIHNGEGVFNIIIPHEIGYWYGLEYPPLGDPLTGPSKKMEKDEEKRLGLEKKLASAWLVRQES